MSQSITERIAKCHPPRRHPLVFMRPDGRNGVIADSLPFHLLVTGDASDMRCPPDAPVFVDRDNVRQVATEFVEELGRDSPCSRLWRQIDRLVHAIETSQLLRVAVAHLPQAELFADLRDVVCKRNARLARLLASGSSAYGLLVSEYRIDDAALVKSDVPALGDLCESFACPMIMTTTLARPFSFDAFRAPESAAYLCAVPSGGYSEGQSSPSFELAARIAQAYSWHGINGVMSGTATPTAYAIHNGHHEFGDLRVILQLSEIVRTIAVIVRDRIRDGDGATGAVRDWLSLLTSRDSWSPDEWQFRYYPIKNFACSQEPPRDDSLRLSLELQLRSASLSRAQACLCGVLSVSEFGFEFALRSGN